MEFLANVFASMSPWTWLTIALVLIIADVNALNSDYLACFGFGCAVVGMLSLADADGTAQVIALPVASIVASLRYPRLVRSWSKQAGPAVNSTNLVGMEGTVSDVDGATPSTGRALLRRNGEWRICSHDGSALQLNTHVRVLGHQGLLLVVRPVVSQQLDEGPHEDV